MTPPPLSLYVHLPWCIKKCPYCDFNSHEFRGDDARGTQDAYIAVGVGVTATSASTPIPAYTPVPFYAPQTGSGAPWQVSALQVSAAGTVYAKPINIR